MYYTTGPKFTPAISKKTIKLGLTFHILTPICLIILFGYTFLAWRGAIKTHFFVPLGLFFLVAFILLRWADKQIVGLNQRTKRFFFLYLFATIIAIMFAWATQTLSWDPRMPVVMMIGFAQAFGSYVHWKAIDISIAKTSLFSFIDDIIPMVLSGIFLNEWRMLTPLTWVGIMTCFGSAIYLMRNNFHNKTSVEEKNHVASRSDLKLWGYILFYSGLWGVAGFFERFFSFNKLPPGNFALAWYPAALFAATLLLYYYKDPSLSQQKMPKEKLTAYDLLFIFYIAAGTVLCLMLAYVFNKTTPQNVSQPLLLVGEAVCGIWVGVYFFNEDRQFTSNEKVVSVIALFGVTLIAMSTFISN